jgi:hypothetical protein
VNAWQIQPHATKEVLPFMVWPKPFLTDQLLMKSPGPTLIAFMSQATMKQTSETFVFWSFLRKNHDHLILKFEFKVDFYLICPLNCIGGNLEFNACCELKR